MNTPSRWQMGEDSDFMTPNKTMVDTIIQEATVVHPPQNWTVDCAMEGGFSSFQSRKMDGCGTLPVGATGGCSWKGKEGGSMTGVIRGSSCAGTVGAGDAAAMSGDRMRSRNMRISLLWRASWKESDACGFIGARLSIRRPFI